MVPSDDGVSVSPIIDNRDGRVLQFFTCVDIGGQIMKMLCRKT